MRVGTGQYNILQTFSLYVCGSVVLSLHLRRSRHEIWDYVGNVKHP